ncbi:MAG: hypothetical protein LBV75_00880, partial [Paludibacter sp.]|nr:hypothetical protein [Paludibacter sp.]
MKKFIKKILVKLKILKAPESYSLRDESIQILNNKAYTVNADENGVRISSDKLTIEGKSENTLWTSAAVLCSEDYHFADADQKYVVFDIGLNIAVTSLYLSQQKNIVKIYGFEPFKETFLQAEQNLLLNPELATKIQIFNFGLSDAD